MTPRADRCPRVLDYSPSSVQVLTELLEPKAPSPPHLRCEPPAQDPQDFGYQALKY
jgi:hypothetical protein